MRRARSKACEKRGAREPSDASSASDSFCRGDWVTFTFDQSDSSLNICSRLVELRDSWASTQSNFEVGEM